MVCAQTRPAKILVCVCLAQNVGGNRGQVASGSLVDFGELTDFGGVIGKQSVHVDGLLHINVKILGGATK
jgi:hypothetical protein